MVERDFSARAAPSAGYHGGYRGGWDGRFPSGSGQMRFRLELYVLKMDMLPDFACPEEAMTCAIRRHPGSSPLLLRTRQTASGFHSIENVLFSSRWPFRLPPPSVKLRSNRVGRRRVRPPAWLLRVIEREPEAVHRAVAARRGA